MKKEEAKKDEEIGLRTQPCPQCEKPIGVLSGGWDAICKNCGFKDPCCE